MDQKHFEALNEELKKLILPTVKKVLRITIRENTGKEKDFQKDLVGILDQLEHHYTNQPKAIFMDIRKEMMVSGLTSFSGYVEPKIDE